MPEDVCHGDYDFDTGDLYADAETLRIPARRIRPDSDAIARAAERLAKARRPLVLAGGGVHLSGAHGALLSFAEAHNIPVAHTLSGKGAIACAHPLSAGLFGRYSRIANDLIEAADCLMVVGCKLGEIATRRYALPPREVPLIHLDIVAEEIGRCARADVALWGDARAGLEDLTTELSGAGSEARVALAGEVKSRMEAWRAEVADRLTSSERPVNMARLVHELNETLPGEAILVADGGFAAHWTGLLYDTKRAGRSYIVNRGLASIGYGLPGAMGAAMADAGPVVALTGDGGFNMMLGELETARRAGLAPTVVVVNNAASGYVKALQQALFGGRFQSSDLSEVDYAKVADALGCHGRRVEDPDTLSDAIAAGLAETARPSVIDVVVTRDPAKMLPGVDNRAVEAKKGDRIA